LPGKKILRPDIRVIDMLRRAQPFPAPPADLPGETFKFSMPVRFVAVGPMVRAKPPPPR